MQNTYSCNCKYFESLQQYNNDMHLLKLNLLNSFMHGKKLNNVQQVNLSTDSDVRFSMAMHLNA